MSTNSYLTWFAKGTMVAGPNGRQTPIEELSVWDTVIDHTGALQGVLVVHRRRPFDNERFCTLKSAANPSDAVTLTDGAVVLTAPWFNSNPERWSWKSLTAINLAKDNFVSVQNGSIVAVQGEKGMPFRKSERYRTYAGETVYAVELAQGAKSIIVNNIAVLTMADMQSREAPPVEEILHFIAAFKQAQTTFTTGCCYWFANILNQRFGGETMYANIENHWVQRIGGRLYDVTGDVTEQYQIVVPWNEWQRREPGVTQRLFRDCIDILPPTAD